MADCYYHRFKPKCWLEVTGEDAFDYLQSQFSNDLRGLEDGKVVYGFFLYRKGKVRADAFVMSKGDGVYILCSYFCEGAKIKEELEKTIIADDVEIEEKDAAGVVLLGKGAEVVFGKLGVDAPEPGKVVQKGDLFIVEGRRSREKNIEIVGGRDAFEGFWSAGKSALKSCEEVDIEWMEYERVVSKIARVPEEIGEESMPQEGGLESSGVSFTKGCYLGQEVMQRLNSMGKVQKNLYLVKIFSEKNNASEALFLGEKRVGELKCFVERNGERFGIALFKNRDIEELKGQGRIKFANGFECEVSGAL